MSNPAFELIGLDALRNDPRYNQDARDAAGEVMSIPRPEYLRLF